MTAKPQWTPAPWRVDPFCDDAGGLSFVEANFREERGEGTYECEADIICTLTNHADARLIAAAPELYTALTAIVNSTDYGADDERPLMRDARAALAKARGE